MSWKSFPENTTCLWRLVVIVVVEMCAASYPKTEFTMCHLFFRVGPKKLEYRCIAGNLHNFCMNLTCRTYRQDGLQIPTYFHCFCWTGYVDQEVLNMISECSSQEIQHTEQREELDITNHELKDDMFFSALTYLWHPVTLQSGIALDPCELVFGPLWIGCFTASPWFNSNEGVDLGQGRDRFIWVGCWLCNLKMIQNSKRYLL